MQGNLFLIKRLAWVLVCLFLRVLFAGAQARDPQTGDAQIRIVSIYGKVYLPDRQPAAFMPIHLSTVRGYGADTTADDKGNFLFEDVPMNQIQLKVNPPKESPYYDAPVTVNISREGVNNFRADIYIVRSVVMVPKTEKTAPVISVREASQQVPSAAQKAYLKGKKYRGQKKFKEALNELDLAIRLYPEYFQAITEKGNVLVSTGHLQEGLTEFDKALRILPSYEPALSGAGFCLLSTGKHEQAIGMLEQAAHIDPANAQNLLFLGIANLALSRWSKAQAALEQALARDQERMASAHLYLAYALAGQELYSRAADEMHTYLTLNPTAPNAGRLRDTEAQWRSQVARGPKQQNPFRMKVF
jgi:tetratricopeptide (TPR) repeat protein